MNSRERFKRTMQHQQPDRVPIDIGGTSLTGMRPGCQQNLRQLLGFPPSEKNSRIDERILQWAGTDFRSVGAIISLPGPHQRKISPQAEVDCWGIRREVIDGEWQITQYPLRGATLADLKAYPWPEPHIDEKLLEKWEQEARALKAENRYVVVAEHPVYGILELGCWMCGYDDFFMKMALEPNFVRCFFNKFFEIQMAVIESYYAVLGPYVDLTTSGDDFGGQNGPLLSPEMFTGLVAPYFTARIQRTKELMPGYFWHHSCGSVYKILDQIIDCGVDILNPIQTSAAQMDPARLKQEFGDRLVFWGAVDVQQFLPHLPATAIPEKINELVRVLGQDGGYVMAPAHEMQDDIPPENIVAWREAVVGGLRIEY